MRLLLIRHGQTPANVAGALDTAVPGLPLTALGEAQAAAVPAALADERVDGIYVSRLVRTQLTAAPLARARDLRVEVRDGFEEVSAGAYEMSSEPEAVEAYVGSLAAWMAGDLDHAVPGGEDGHAFRARYDAAVAAVVDAHRPDATAVVFSHGAAIRAYAALATRLSPEESHELWLANTGLAVLVGDPASGWRLDRWHAEPLGGSALLDRAAQDVTGESTDDLDAETD
ncbi:histidine phosphatase family protein [Microlunatus antarcticus]|uniref:Putative phosphoglycerate mutase n=1 Tax=Microlunatus antarcticus TaxID=53388 RepID=A0A7W5JX87_9ACTN|nr:putative phosphoglycerate mutase [Microlunatus antarcticus]